MPDQLLPFRVQPLDVVEEEAVWTLIRPGDRELAVGALIRPRCQLQGKLLLAVEVVNVLKREMSLGLPWLG